MSSRSSTREIVSLLPVAGFGCHFAGSTEITPREIIPNDPAQKLARNWIAAWNTSDILRLAAFYDSACRLSNPAVVTILNEPSGVLTRKSQHLRFWGRLLERSEFSPSELFGVFRGVQSIIIYYRSSLGKIAMEIMWLNAEGLICESITHFDQF